MIEASTITAINVKTKAGGKKTLHAEKRKQKNGRTKEPTPTTTATIKNKNACVLHTTKLRHTTFLRNGIELCSVC